MINSTRETLLILQARTGDRESLEQLLAGIQLRLLGYISAVVGRTAADDVLQDAFLQICRNLKWLRDPELFIAVGLPDRKPGMLQIPEARPPLPSGGRPKHFAGRGSLGFATRTATVFRVAGTVGEDLARAPRFPHPLPQPVVNDLLRRPRYRIVNPHPTILRIVRPAVPVHHRLVPRRIVRRPAILVLRVVHIARRHVPRRRDPRRPCRIHPAVAPRVIAEAARPASRFRRGGIP